MPEVTGVLADLLEQTPVRKKQTDVEGYTRRSTKLDEREFGKSLIEKVRGVIPNKPGVKNWVEVAGGLPAYIDDVAGALYTKRGFTVSHAIATAVNKMKKWAAGGDGVSEKTRIKAARALAQWEKMKGKARLKKSVGVEETTIEEVEAVLALGAEVRNKILQE